MHCAPHWVTAGMSIATMAVLFVKADMAFCIEEGTHTQSVSQLYISM